jgi:glycosyltransferase involved in cell wall biosynthesis
VAIAKIAAPQAAIVRTVHNVFLASGFWFVKRWLRALAVDRFVSTIVAPSEDVRINETKLRRRATVILNWVDARYASARKTRALAPVERSVIFVGNCSPIKNHLQVLEELAGSDIRIRHIGVEESAPPDEIGLLDRLETESQVIERRAGDPLPSLVASDVFVMPSLHEGMGVALAEALEMGMPAVVADVPGLQWARGISGVRHVKTGESWHAAIRQALSGPRHFDDRSNIDFTADRGASEYASLYRPS